MDKKIFEILVDKNNLKGPAVFEHILVVLHQVFEDFRKGKNLKFQEAFSFEITKVANRIRFFIISPKKYSNFLQNQIYAHFTDVEIVEVGDYLKKIPNDKIQIGEIELKKHHFYSIKDFTEISENTGKETIDPFSSISSALSRTGTYTLNTFQINFVPILANKWKKNPNKTIDILTSKHPEFIKKIMFSKYFFLLKFIFAIFIWIWKLIVLPFKNIEETDEIEENTEENKYDKFSNKLEKEAYAVSINIIHAGEEKFEGRGTIKEIASTLSIFSNFGQNSFKLKDIKTDEKAIFQAKNRNIGIENILTTKELSGLVHLPTSYVKTPQINWVSSRAFEPPSNLPIIDPDLSDDIDVINDLTPIGITNFRGTNMSFGIGPNDRRRHMYVLGKTGMGKSTLLENMIIDDMKKGRGVAVIDPHGDLAETVIGFIPKSRTNGTIIFDPTDKDWPIAFNMLENVAPEHRSLVASGVVGIFKKIFGDSWGPRLEHILRNIIFALLEYPNSTLISIPLMLTSEVFRNKVVAKVTDPVVKNFWSNEFAKMSPNQKSEASGPILNKVGQFLSSTILRNILGQPKNSFSIRWAMDNKKIIIINLSKGSIGEDASALLGAMMVTKFQLDAMSRSDIKEDERKDFYLYVDEFQNFATDSFATILSEARKYKLNLVMANQYIDQMQESVKGAVFGNIGSLVSFQVGFNDANILKDVLNGGITEEDLMNLKKYNIYTKELIDGMPSPVFSASTFEPNKKSKELLEKRYQKILTVSREKYSKPRKSIADKIHKNIDDLEKQEKAWERKKEEFKQKQKEKKQKERLEQNNKK